MTKSASLSVLTWLSTEVHNCQYSCLMMPRAGHMQQLAEAYLCVKSDTKTVATTRVRDAIGKVTIPLL